MMSSVERPTDQACRLNFPYHDRALAVCPTRPPSTASAGCIKEANSKLHNESTGKPRAAFKYCITLSGTRCCHRLVAKSGEARKGLAPGGDRRLAFEHFRYPQARTLGRLRRQRTRIIETAGEDLVVRLGQTVLPVIPDDIDRDVVSTGNVAVEEQTVQSRFARKVNSPLLDQLAPQRVAEAFADFDAAARQVPAGDITVLDQKHPVVAIQHHGADPKRHAAGEPPIEVKSPPQHRLHALSQGLRVHRH